MVGGVADVRRNGAVSKSCRGNGVQPRARVILFSSSAASLATTPGQLLRACQKDSGEPVVCRSILGKEFSGPGRGSICGFRGLCLCDDNLQSNLPTAEASSSWQTERASLVVNLAGFQDPGTVDTWSIVRPRLSVNEMSHCFSPLHPLIWSGCQPRRVLPRLSLGAIQHCWTLNIVPDFLMVVDIGLPRDPRVPFLPPNASTDAKDTV